MDFMKSRNVDESSKYTSCARLFFLLFMNLGLCKEVVFTAVTVSNERIKMIMNVEARLFWPSESNLIGMRKSSNSLRQNSASG